MVMMVVMIVGVGIIIYDCSYNKNNYPAAIKCVKAGDMFSGEQQNNIGSQGHNNTYRRNKLVRIHLPEIV
jgi:hypothetical protein